MVNRELISQRSLWKRQAIKHGRRGRYLEVPEITLQSIREDAVEAGLVTDILRCISAGKEADIYLALWKDAPLILKAYRLHRTPHRKKSLLGYAEDVVTYWAAREFWVMQRAYRLGVRVPAPAGRVDNMLTMLYLAEDGLPAPMLKDAEVQDPSGMLELICSDVATLYRNYLVHGDLSKFNILVYQEKPYLIDFPQAMDFSSRLTRVCQMQEAKELLLRDLSNIASFFKGRGLQVDAESIFSEIAQGMTDDWLSARWEPVWKSNAE